MYLPSLLLLSIYSSLWRFIPLPVSNLPNSALRTALPTMHIFPLSDVFSHFTIINITDVDDWWWWVMMVMMVIVMISDYNCYYSFLTIAVLWAVFLLEIPLILVTMSSYYFLLYEVHKSLCSWDIFYGLYICSSYQLLLLLSMPRVAYVTGIPNIFLTLQVLQRQKPSHSFFIISSFFITRLPHVMWMLTLRWFFTCLI